MLPRMVAATVGRVEEERRRRVRAAEQGRYMILEPLRPGADTEFVSLSAVIG